MMQPIPLEMFSKTLINFIPYDCLVSFEYDDKAAVFADNECFFAVGKCDTGKVDQTVDQIVDMTCVPR